MLIVQRLATVQRSLVQRLGRNILPLGSPQPCMQCRHAQANLKGVVGDCNASVIQTLMAVGQSWPATDQQLGLRLTHDLTLGNDAMSTVLMRQYAPRMQRKENRKVLPAGISSLVGGFPIALPWARLTANTQHTVRKQAISQEHTCKVIHDAQRCRMAGTEDALPPAQRFDKQLLGLFEAAHGHQHVGQVVHCGVHAVVLRRQNL